MADVFLSYSSQDRAAADRVQETLSARGMDVFWDEETPPGVDWDTWIRTKLSTAKVAVVLWSKASIVSPNVRHEAILARDAGKLVPAMIEKLAPSDFPMGLYLVQAVDLLDWRNSDARGYASLVAEIRARLGQAPLPEPDKAPRPLSSRAMLLGGAVFVVAMLAVGAWILMNPGPGTATEPSKPSQASSSAGTASTGPFSRRMLGHWRWNDAQPCESGSNITVEDGKLVFTAPGSRFVHAIQSDSALETRTRVLEPDKERDDEYVLTPEFFANSGGRSFNLLVTNTTEGTKDTWSPCEP